MRFQPIIELLIAPGRAALRAGISEHALAALRRRDAGPRWRRYCGGALYSTDDLDCWRQRDREPRWASNAA